MSEPLKKILIVDDEVKIIEVVKSFLESKGFSVVFAENGKEALNIFENEQIAMILLDLMLPDMTGEEICALIRKKSRVPIIMLTAKVEESDLIKGLNIGADDYITKPFSLKELYARIEAVLRRAGNDLVPLYNQMAFNNGDLEVDFESHMVRKNHKTINLTPIEYKILTALIQYPGKVFTRDELINRALGDEFDGYDRAVDSHIKNLRQKIETDPRKPVYITTIFGIGYKFGGE